MLQGSVGKVLEYFDDCFSRFPLQTERVHNFLPDETVRNGLGAEKRDVKFTVEK